jgi:hypothetical protein
MAGRRGTTEEIEAEALDFYEVRFHKLFREDPVDEVTRYVFLYCRPWMTAAERETLRYCALSFMAGSCTDKRSWETWERRAKAAKSLQVDELLADGERRFLERVRDRVVAEHGSEALNLCPKCTSLLRTASARQCSKCYHQWHRRLSPGKPNLGLNWTARRSGLRA